MSPQMFVPFAVLAGAIPVLIALRYAPGMALAVAAAGTVSAAWIVFAMGQAAELDMSISVGEVAGLTGMFFGPPLLAMLLRRNGSLNLCYQVAVLVTAAILVAVHMLLPDPTGVWVKLLQQLAAAMSEAGLGPEGDVDAMIAIWARSMWGALAATSFAIVLSGLFLGGWWQSLLESPGQFGTEYRQLRLGRVLGLCVTVLFVSAFFVESALLASLAWVAFAALVFQGLAAAHRAKAQGGLNRGWLAAIYVLLIVPLSTSITVFALALWGYADNWLRPRTQGV